MITTSPHPPPSLPMYHTRRYHEVYGRQPQWVWAGRGEGWEGRAEQCIINEVCKRRLPPGRRLLVSALASLAANSASDLHLYIAPSAARPAARRMLRPLGHLAQPRTDRGGHRLRLWSMGSGGWGRLPSLTSETFRFSTVRKARS